MTALKLYTLQQNLIEDLKQDSFPAIVRSWQGNLLELPVAMTHIGFVYQGQASLLRGTDATSYPLHPGMYFCLPGAGKLSSTQSSGFVITLPDYQGMFNLGGPIEQSGRFAYIDGGTSSLLIPPMIKGDPCLNAMFFPPGVDQTLHTHPSYRFGIVVAGSGEVETPATVAKLEPGTLFLIAAETLHKFRTQASHLTVVVFHPDSDLGFTHQHHPMLSRTLINGISAVELPHLQTKLPDGS